MCTNTELFYFSISLHTGNFLYIFFVISKWVSGTRIWVYRLELEWILVKFLGIKTYFAASSSFVQVTQAQRWVCPRPLFESRRFDDCFLFRSRAFGLSCYCLRFCGVFTPFDFGLIGKNGRKILWIPIGLYIIYKKMVPFTMPPFPHLTKMKLFNAFLITLRQAQKRYKLWVC